MRRKRLGGGRSRATPEPVPYDFGASARQVGLIESATGAMHGLGGVIMALVAAVSMAAVRAWWRANTRPTDRRR